MFCSKLKFNWIYLCEFSWRFLPKHVNLKNFWFFSFFYALLHDLHIYSSCSVSFLLRIPNLNAIFRFCWRFFVLFFARSHKNASMCLLFCCIQKFLFWFFSFFVSLVATKQRFQSNGFFLSKNVLWDYLVQVHALNMHSFVDAMFLTKEFTLFYCFSYNKSKINVTDFEFSCAKF